MNTKERVRRWVDGELDGTAATALLAEASRSPDLARALRDARMVAAELAQAGMLTPATPPDDFVERTVRRAIRTRAEHDARPRPWWDWLLQPVTLRVRVWSLMASALIVTVGLTGLRAWRIERNALRATAAATSAARERVAMRPREVTMASDRERATTDITATAAEPKTVPVRFVLPAHGAHAVAVAGDFNRWQPQDASLRDDDGDGVFVGTLRLLPGTYAYMFVVDGERWVSDPYATNVRDDGFGHQNAVLRIN